MGSSHPSAGESPQRILEQHLPAFLAEQRWFGGKTRVVRSAKIIDSVPVALEGTIASIHLVRIDYQDGGAETYAVPLLERDGAAAADRPALQIPGGNGTRILSDALRDPEFLAKLLDLLVSAAQLPGTRGELAGLPTPALEKLLRAAEFPLEPSLMKVEQSNSSILYGRSFILKFFRHVEEGINPDFEMGEFLSVRARFAHVPVTAGSFEYRRAGAEPAMVGILQSYVANRGDAWKQTLAALGGFYDQAESGGLGSAPADASNPVPGDRARQPSDAAGIWLGNYRAAAYRLGQLTGELHLALSSDPSDPGFRPEPFSLEYQMEVSGSMMHLAEETFDALRRRAASLPATLEKKTQAALAAEGNILRRYRLLGERPLTGLRTRVHGDLHLGQILDTGGDFVFIDFEGEPARSMAERRAKHSPLRDVAGMLRSFHYAAYAALFQRMGEAGAEASRFAALAPFADGWHRLACAEYLRGYLDAAGRAAFLPAGTGEMEFLLNLWLLDKAVYELKYELNHRPGWAAIPLEGICDLAESRFE